MKPVKTAHEFFLELLTSLGVFTILVFVFDLFLWLFFRYFLPELHVEQAKVIPFGILVWTLGIFGLIGFNLGGLISRNSPMISFAGGIAGATTMVTLTSLFIYAINHL